MPNPPLVTIPPPGAPEAAAAGEGGAAEGVRGPGRADEGGAAGAGEQAPRHGAGMVVMVAWAYIYGGGWGLGGGMEKGLVADRLIHSF